MARVSQENQCGAKHPNLPNVTCGRDKRTHSATDGRLLPHFTKRNGKALQWGEIVQLGGQKVLDGVPRCEECGEHLERVKA